MSTGDELRGQVTQIKEGAEALQRGLAVLQEELKELRFRAMTTALGSENIHAEMLVSVSSRMESELHTVESDASVVVKAAEAYLRDLS